MRRFTLPLLVLSLVPLVAGCSGGGAGSPTNPNTNVGVGSSRAVTLTIDWSARGRAAPSSALSARATITGGGTDGSDVVFVCNRGTNPGVHSESYSSNRPVRFGTHPLTLRFFSEPGAAGTEVASASSSLTNDETGIRGGSVNFSQKIVSVEIAPNQSFPIGADSTVRVISRDSANNVVAISEGSALLEVVEGGDRGQIVNGRLRGLANGTVRLRATVDGISSAPVLSAVGRAGVTVGVQGTRGSLPLTINSSQQLVTPGRPLSSVGSLAGANPLSAPASYGDRVFLAWRRGETEISTSPTLPFLPSELGASETLTAVYGPMRARPERLSPHFNQEDPSYWPSDRPIKLFFEESISAEHRAALLEGFRRWSDALGTALFSVVSVASEATVTVRFTPLSGPAQTTVTTSRLTAPRPILSAVISFDDTKLPSVSVARERGVLVALASHEFGHLLGIRGSVDQGHSQDPLDTMFAVVSEDTNFITPRDINTIQNIYFSAEGTFDGRKRPTPTRASETFTETIPCHVRLGR